MSARAEAPQIRGTFTWVVAAAIVVAVGLGVAVASVVTRPDAVRPRAVVTTEAPLWDEQKLEAMAGRVLAERYRVEPQVVVGWDEGKLEAMAGRILAEEIRAEDPIRIPHVPKRPPAHEAQVSGHAGDGAYPGVSPDGWRIGGGF